MSFTPGQTVRDFAAVTLSERLLRKSTAHSYMQTIRHLGMDDVPVEEVTVQYLYSRLLTVTNPNTQRKHTVALRAIFRDSLPGIKELKISKSIPRVYAFPPEEDIRRVIEASPYKLYGYLMMYAGLRIGEAVVVRPSDVEGNVLKVYRQRDEDGTLVLAKTQGSVIIPEWLAALIKEHVEEVVTSGAVRESLWRYGRKEGVTINPHMLRKWYCTKMVKKRINPEIAKRQMRHADLKTTLGYYAQVEKEDIDSVVLDLFNTTKVPLEEKPKKKGKKSKKDKNRAALQKKFNEWLESQELDD
ncbi:tyrosine-type recombinase/integrase [Streptomyces sp. NPDC059513]|uniref:tyrosine-type recombinase/integrase n=1 Tax=unclassified Streptomyces TaxID=2593676 RepID=UPI0036C37581